MKKSTLKNVWMVERISDGFVLGIFSDKLKALSAIKSGEESGGYSAIDACEQMAMDDLPCFVRAFSNKKDDKCGSQLLFVYIRTLDNRSGMMFVL